MKSKFHGNYFSSHRTSAGIRCPLFVGFHRQSKSDKGNKMAGRVRSFERNESVRHQALGMTRDPHGVDPSREPRESHTAPSGLPATRSGDAYSALGRVKLGELQKKWGINKLSEYSLQKEFIEEDQKRTVDEKGREGYTFKLSMLFYDYL